VHGSTVGIWGGSQGATQGSVVVVSGLGAGGSTPWTMHLGMCLIWGSPCGASCCGLPKVLLHCCIHGAGVLSVSRS